ncbi:hypothetical protein Hanom_Chr12g01148181 [Helianthus anomalus]
MGFVVSSSLSMANKSNMDTSFSVLTREKFEDILETYSIPRSFNPVLPGNNEPIYPFKPCKISLYTRVFVYCNYRIPFTTFLIQVLSFHGVHISQMNPFGLAKVNHFEISCCGLGAIPDLNVFRAFYKLTHSGIGILLSLKDWKDSFFIDNLCVPTTMHWQPKKSTLPKALSDNFVYDEGLFKGLVKNANRRTYLGDGCY